MSDYCQRATVYSWTEFNAWARGIVNRTARRPGVLAIRIWMEANAERVWPDPTLRPPMEAACRHAKGLRSKDEVRTYFRKYRAMRAMRNEAWRDNKNVACKSSYLVQTAEGDEDKYGREGYGSESKDVAQRVCRADSDGQRHSDRDAKHCNTTEALRQEPSSRPQRRRREPARYRSTTPIKRHLNTTAEADLSAAEAENLSANAALGPSAIIAASRASTAEAIPDCNDASDSENQGADAADRKTIDDRYTTTGEGDGYGSSRDDQTRSNGSRGGNVDLALRPASHNGGDYSRKEDTLLQQQDALKQAYLYRTAGLSFATTATFSDAYKVHLMRLVAAATGDPLHSDAVTMRPMMPETLGDPTQQQQAALPRAYSATQELQAEWTAEEVRRGPSAGVPGQRSPQRDAHAAPIKPAANHHSAGITTQIGDASTTVAIALATSTQAADVIPVVIERVPEIIPSVAAAVPSPQTRRAPLASLSSRQSTSVGGSWHEAAPHDVCTEPGRNGLRTVRTGVAARQTTRHVNGIRPPAGPERCAMDANTEDFLLQTLVPNVRKRIASDNGSQSQRYTKLSRAEARAGDALLSISSEAPDRAISFTHAQQPSERRCPSAFHQKCTAGVADYPRLAHGRHVSEGVSTPFSRHRTWRWDGGELLPIGSGQTGAGAGPSSVMHLMSGGLAPGGPPLGLSELGYETRMYDSAGHSRPLGLVQHPEKDPSTATDAVRLGNDDMMAAAVADQSHDDHSALGSAEEENGAEQQAAQQLLMLHPGCDSALLHCQNDLEPEAAEEPTWLPVNPYGPAYSAVYYGGRAANVSTRTHLPMLAYPVATPPELLHRFLQHCHLQQYNLQQEYLQQQQQQIDQEFIGLQRLGHQLRMGYLLHPQALPPPQQQHCPVYLPSLLGGDGVDEWSARRGIRASAAAGVYSSW